MFNTLSYDHKSSYKGGFMCLELGFRYALSLSFSLLTCPYPKTFICVGWHKADHSLDIISLHREKKPHTSNQIML